MHPFMVIVLSSVTMVTLGMVGGVTSLGEAAGVVVADGEGAIIEYDWMSDFSNQLQVVTQWKI